MPASSRPQRTIASETEVRGVGFFHGRDVVLRFRPAGADAGVTFMRTDLPGRPSVRATIENVVHTPRRTTIRDGEASVELVEHVLAALAGLNVDNCLIEIDAPEAPGCDGSSLAFVEALTSAGFRDLDRPREVFVIDRPVTVHEGQSAITASPGSEPRPVLSYHLDYGKGNAIGAQSFFLELTPESFASELAPSRTFVLDAEARALREAGIGSRATESDLLIFGPDGPVGNTLRYPDECVRHKILDMVGDLALLGRDIVGHVVAHRSGHALNAKLVRALLSGEADEGAGDLSAVMQTLPNRYPHLLIDRVVEVEPGRRVYAEKRVGNGEPFFNGRRQGRPFMPGLMVLEALAQTAAVMIAEHVGRSGKHAVITALDQVTIGAPVVPGDLLALEVSCLALQPNRAAALGVATVEGRFAAEAKIQFVLVDADRSAA